MLWAAEHRQASTWLGDHAIKLLSWPTNSLDLEMNSASKPKYGPLGGSPSRPTEEIFKGLIIRAHRMITLAEVRQTLDSWPQRVHLRYFSNSR
eukprot:3760134-Amphidinium_carterae.1